MERATRPFYLGSFVCVCECVWLITQWENLSLSLTCSGHRSDFFFFFSPCACEASALPLELHPSPFVFILLLRQDLSNFAQTGLELKIFLPPSSGYLGLEACATTPWEVFEWKGFGSSDLTKSSMREGLKIPGPCKYRWTLHLSQGKKPGCPILHHGNCYFNSRRSLSSNENWGLDQPTERESHLKRDQKFTGDSVCVCVCVCRGAGREREREWERAIKSEKLTWVLHLIHLI
jgi:hypothetical protein